MIGSRNIISGNLRSKSDVNTIMPISENITLCPDGVCRSWETNKPEGKSLMLNAYGYHPCSVQVRKPAIIVHHLTPGWVNPLTFLSCFSCCTPILRLYSQLLVILILPQAVQSIEVFSPTGALREREAGSSAGPHALSTYRRRN